MNIPNPFSYSREFFVHWAMQLKAREHPKAIISVVEKDGTPLMGYHPIDGDGSRIQFTAVSEEESRDL